MSGSRSFTATVALVVGGIAVLAAVGFGVYVLVDRADDSAAIVVDDARGSMTEDQNPSPSESESQDDDVEPDPGEPVAFIGSQPEAGATGVDPQAGFRFQFDGGLASSPTMTIELLDIAAGTTRTLAADAMSIDLTRQNLSVAFSEPLAVYADHRLSLSGVVSLDGAPLEPIEFEFRTGPLAGGSDQFEVTKLADVIGPTGVVFGPDGQAYVTTVGGEIIRFAIGVDGQPTGEQTVVVSNSQFQFITLTFEPGSDTTVWVSQWLNDPPNEFSSEIATYDLSIGAGSEVKKVTGLPRHPDGNHSVQGLDFNEGRLYAAIGSVTAGGASSASFFGPPLLEENQISAAIIEIDYTLISEPVDTNAMVVDDASEPVRLFATGIRNAYDLMWHSNGNLYANINQNSGSPDEDSPSPTDGLCEGLPAGVASNLIPDTLNLIERGGYYGHPNPFRGECIVMGGGQGPFAVEGYETDQLPEQEFDEDLIVFYTTDRSGSFGISVNGMDEYRGSGPLQGAIISADFSGSRGILVARIGSPTSRMVLDGEIERLATPTGEVATFNHPVDVASSADGSVLVADFGEWLGGRYGDGGGVYFLDAVTG